MFQNGDIMSYIIRYYPGKPSEQQQKKESSSGPLTRFANLTHLTKNTNYTIIVLASNDKGTGPASDPIVVATSDGSKYSFCLIIKYVREDIFIFNNY